MPFIPAQMRNDTVDNTTLYKRVVSYGGRFTDKDWYEDHKYPLPAFPYEAKWTICPKVRYAYTLTRSEFHWYYGWQEVTYNMDSGALYLADYVNTFPSLIAEYNATRQDVLTDIEMTALELLKGQSLAVGMMWRERKQTGALLLGAADTACRAIRALASKNPIKMYRILSGKNPNKKMRRTLRNTAKRVIRAGGSVGDAWLQYRYAWTPFILDVRDSIKATGVTQEKLNRCRIKANAKKRSTQYTQTIELFAQDLPHTFNVDGDFYGQAIVYYSVSNPWAAAIAGLMNVEATIWDAIPFSFVFDWFVDISSYLDLREATVGLEFQSGFISVMERRSIVDVSAPRVDMPLYNGKPCWYVRPTLPMRSDITLTRTVLSSFPTPSIRFIGNGVTPNRFVDVVSFGLGLLRRRFG